MIAVPAYNSFRRAGDLSVSTHIDPNILLGTSSGRSSASNNGSYRWGAVDIKQNGKVLRKQSFRHERSQAELGSEVTAYERDSLSRITTLTETNQGNITIKKYSYDIAGRLWQVWKNDTLISTYSYDPNGNRISHWTPTKVDSGTYDAQDRMLSYSSTQGLNGLSAQYLYTPSGELKTKIDGTDTTYYTYDFFGNLITVQLPNSDRIDYIVDGQNRRIGKKVNGQIVKRWIYSGQLSPVAELDSVGNVVSQFIGSYMIKNGVTYKFITDHLGSIRLIVDVNTGDVTQKIDYDEYGNVIYDSNPDFQPFAYAHGLYDAQTKLIRFGARDFDATIGRWTKKDPIGFGGKVSNLYEYVINDPINNLDVFGLKECKRKKNPNPLIDFRDDNIADIAKAAGVPEWFVESIEVAMAADAVATSSIIGLPYVILNMMESMSYEIGGGNLHAPVPSINEENEGAARADEKERQTMRTDARTDASSTAYPNNMGNLPPGRTYIENGQIKQRIH